MNLNAFSALLRQQERVEQKRCELQKAFKFFKDRLGLQFKKISGMEKIKMFMMIQGLWFN